MYRIDVIEYHRNADEMSDYCMTFETKVEAMEYAESLKDDNVGIWLIEYTQDEYGDWLENEPICLQEIDYND